jgi:hypothetical protein
MHLLQCNVASEGRGDDTEVVLMELAPFSSSTRIFFEQNGKNFAKVLSAFAFATHSTS